MEKTVIIDAIRTPMGRSKEGIFRFIRAENLSAHLMCSLLERNPNTDIALLDDIYWGCVQQTREQGMNIARNATLLAGLPYRIPAVTVNRLCGSSMQALHDAHRAIVMGDARICIAGGVEHMGHLPMSYGIDFNPEINRFVAKAAMNMGLTAELLSHLYQIDRKMQDQFALRSHQLALEATQSGFFEHEIVPTAGHNPLGTLSDFQLDEVIRANTSLEALSALAPVFDPKQGSVTAGNSSAISDGASAVLLTSQTTARNLGLKPRARIRATSVVGCEPSIMGIGPVAAIHLVLEKAGLSIEDIAIFELNEAFAAQALACLKELKLLDQVNDKVNLHGGAIALGHPLGCSGTRIITTLLNVMERKDAQFGLASMCIGLGQGIATIIERI